MRVRKTLNPKRRASKGPAKPSTQPSTLRKAIHDRKPKERTHLTETQAARKLTVHQDSSAAVRNELKLIQPEPQRVCSESGINKSSRCIQDHLAVPLTGKKEHDCGQTVQLDPTQDSQALSHNDDLSNTIDITVNTRREERVTFSQH